ncbi:hypothetical protein K438DRAFT_1980067 [Mycena galopus ATCC 62051]|nr:hypothetical protein K438DRAFT_1980067 [Mycena galopus ATCC 62051]
MNLAPKFVITLLQSSAKFTSADVIIRLMQEYHRLHGLDMADIDAALLTTRRGASSSVSLAGLRKQEKKSRSRKPHPPPSSIASSHASDTDSDTLPILDFFLQINILA